MAQNLGMRVLHSGLSVPPIPQIPRRIVPRATPETKESTKVEGGPWGLGDLLGPIGITVGKSFDKEKEKPKKDGGAQFLQNAADKAGVSLGPIGLTIGSDLKADSSTDEDDASPPPPPAQSIATMTTAQSDLAG